MTTSMTMTDASHPFSGLVLDLACETHTVALAQALAPCVIRDAANHGARIYLRGDLGAGKTSFARALLRAGGVTGRIKSPSYALLESYKVSNLYFYHLDFYRFEQGCEWQDAGFDDVLYERAVILLEWPERATGSLPPPDLDIRLDYACPGRRATLTAHSTQGRLWLLPLASHFPLAS